MNKKLLADEIKKMSGLDNQDNSMITIHIDMAPFLAKMMKQNVSKNEEYQKIDGLSPNVS